MIDIYNILWLDDQPIKVLEQIKEANPELLFEKIDYVDVCKKLLVSQPQKYHAVILDANGLNSETPNKDANKLGFLELVHLVLDNHIPLYIYSGQLLRASDGDPSDIVYEELNRLGLKEDETIFFKSGGPYGLIDRIKKDLKEYNKILYSYPEILDNVLHYGVNRECVQDLLLWMEDKNRPFPEYLSLRRIIFDEILNKELKAFFNLETGSIHKDLITEECMSDWEKLTIFYLKDLLHAQIHNWPWDNPQFQEIIANAFKNF